VGDRRQRINAHVVVPGSLVASVKADIAQIVSHAAFPEQDR